MRATTPASWPRHWLRWTLAVSTVTAACTLLLWPAKDHQRAPATSSAPASRSDIAVAPPSLPAVVPQPRTAARSMLVAIEPTPALDRSEVEVCGFGRVSLPADDPSALQRVPPALRRAALEQADAMMLASDDAQVRAAALLLGARAGGADAHARIESVARLAIASQDATVYAIALQACKAQSADGSACQLLSRAQWARLDPDNALPWLELAAEAQAQQQASELEADAMRHAALAQRSDVHMGLLPQLVERALGAASPLQRTLALAESWSAQAAWTSAHSTQAYAYCMSDTADDGTRAATCDALADTLARRGASLTDMGTGLAIAKHLNWTAQRLQALQQEHDAISETSGIQDFGQDWSCDAVTRLQDWTRQLAQHGEVQAMRGVLAHSGRSVEQWSAQHRKNIAVAMAATEAATSVAPGEAVP